MERKYIHKDCRRKRMYNPMQSKHLTVISSISTSLNYDAAVRDIFWKCQHANKSVIPKRHNILERIRSL